MHPIALAIFVGFVHPGRGISLYNTSLGEFRQ